jgi:hypothetical protein
MFYVGIVGHRYLRNSAAARFVFEQSQSVLRKTRLEHGVVTALSAIAEGADTLFAEAALSLAVPLEIVRPFTTYDKDFESTAAIKRYERLRAAARCETELPFKDRSNDAYRVAMGWIVDASDFLVVAWDGRPASGGTGHAVQRLNTMAKPWLHLDVNDLSARLKPGIKLNHETIARELQTTN